ncbi:hypothetical protein [Rheinheimera oceanensis]|uniref:hypothetical protein n=1 Tax=Rheinheimera oceanensis TaxID=2817449 RepID=UPI001BFD38EF|nr:hypothetical protein [Rheinheimera oceanensis]
MIKKIIKISLLISPAFLIFGAHAAASAIHTPGQIRVSWTNDASTHCPTNQVSYYLKEHINGTYTKTIDIYYASQKYININVPVVAPMNTTYEYVVHYFKCYGSGGIYLIAGSTTTNISPAPAAGHGHVIYIHTDILGSTIAESDNSGNVIKRYYYMPFGKKQD